MRLSKKEINIIKKALENQFGSEYLLYLFGSRVDNNKKGGDIDLLLELKQKFSDTYNRKIKVLTEIKLKIGEQKIDLIITDQGKKDTRLVVQTAYKTGVLL